MIDPLILVRAVHFAATALAAGTVAFLVFAAEPAFHAAGTGVQWNGYRRACCWLTWAALAVAAASGAVWLVWLAADIYGASLVNVCVHGGALSVLNDTRFGQVWMIRLALALLLGLLMLWPATRHLQLVCAAGLIGALACVGHSGAKPGAVGNIQLGSDILHLVGAGMWVGALPALAMLLHRERRTGSRPAVAGAVARFSPLGIASLCTLLATGVVNSWNLLAGPSDLITTNYGRLILLKIGLFVAMVGIAAVNRFRLTPRLAAQGAMRALERNSLAEVGLGLWVFLFVGALGTMAPASHDHVHIPSGPVPADAAFVHIHSTDAMAEVTIEPGRVGPARATILLMREDFSILTAKDVTLLLTPQAPSAEAPIARSAVRLPNGVWQVDGLEIRQSGIWTIKLSINAGSGPSIVLDAPIAIER